MKNREIFSLSEILNEMSIIEKKINWLQKIGVLEVQIWYREFNNEGFQFLPQRKIPFSFTVEIQKLINDSIEKHQTTFLNLKELLNQQK
jgi:hypothetical protein